MKRGLISLSVIAIIVTGGLFVFNKKEDVSNINNNQEIELNNDNLIEIPSEDENENNSDIGIVDEIENENSDENDKEVSSENDLNSEDNKETSKEDASSIKVTTTKGSGVFQGFADSNFVEIKNGNDYTVYMVAESAKKDMKSKDFEEKISFSYKTENGSKIIVSVD